MKRWRMGPADLVAGLDEHGPCTAWIERAAPPPATMANVRTRPMPMKRSASDRLDRLIACIDAWAEDPSTVCPASLVPTGPEFHRTCWLLSRTIMPGDTLSYGGLAARAGRPNAARAAAQSMARNRLAPLVPCHRVVAAAGLGGFLGVGGRIGAEPWALCLKRWLLEREGAPAVG